MMQQQWMYVNVLGRVTGYQDMCCHHFGGDVGHGGRGGLNSPLIREIPSRHPYIHLTSITEHKGMRILIMIRIEMHCHKDCV